MTADIKKSFKDLDDIVSELVNSGLISSNQLAVARVTQKNLGGDLGHILIKKGFVTEEQLVQFLSEQLHVPYIELKDVTIDVKLTKFIPASMAKKYNIIPISKKGDVLTLALADPMDLFSLDDIKIAVKCILEPILTSKEDVQKMISELYRSAVTVSGVEDETIEMMGLSEEDEAEASEKLQEIASGTKVVAAVNNLIIRAYKEHVSDIHIEPMQELVKVRYRIDGLLEERMVLPKNMHLPVISRLKIISGMDIAERRIPQDGRVRLKIHGEQLDMRLSTYPTMHGEKVVIRLLSKGEVIGLDELGFSGDDEAKFANLITRPHGILLVTGPTGSGKTTTLYAALQRVNSQDKNIISIEDPIENEIAGVNQAQVNLKAGVTFAAALRSILRQDPDIIMVGEIRDAETAEIAVRAAMTGHLVFSTLHTNTAIGAVARLMDLGLEPFLLSSSLLGVMAQRLVRVICKECRQEVEPHVNHLKILGIEGPDVHVYAGRGCKACRMTGFKGRSGIFELVPISDRLKKMISERVPETDLLKVAREEGAHDMREDGIAKILSGVTTTDEVIRVTQEE